MATRTCFSELDASQALDAALKVPTWKRPVPYRPSREQQQPATYLTRRDAVLGLLICAALICEPIGLYALMH